jgi:hypothetical protein
MKLRGVVLAIAISSVCLQAGALALGPEEFQASRKLACVLAEQTLGYLSEDEYGEKTHNVLDGFDQAEQDTILAKALGYYDGLMFAIASDDQLQVSLRLETFVASESCRGADLMDVTVSL